MIRRKNTLLKIVIGLVIAIFVLWICLVTTDAIRLKKSDFLSKPLINLYKTNVVYCGIYNDYRSEIFTGIGYTVEYEYYDIESNTASQEKSAKFNLFGIIPVWSWEK